MIYLAVQTVKTVIELAEFCYPQQEVKIGPGINPFSDMGVVKRAFAPNPEKEKLERYIDELGENEKAGLATYLKLGLKLKGSCFFKGSNWNEPLTLVL